MLTQVTRTTTISIPQALKLVGIIGGVRAILLILGAVMAIVQSPYQNKTRKSGFSRQNHET